MLTLEAPRPALQRCTGPGVRHAGPQRGHAAGGRGQADQAQAAPGPRQVRSAFLILLDYSSSSSSSPYLNIYICVQEEVSQREGAGAAGQGLGPGA